MEWSKGELIGRGSFATVSLAHVRRPDPELPMLMAVKSSPLSVASFLRHEESVLSTLGACSNLIRYYGHDITANPTTGAQSYNLFLEYASGGSLQDGLRRASRGKFPESAVRRHARSILLGLRHIHSSGYAHCDIKLSNILVDANGDAKIADFGLAVKASEGVCGGGLRGTPLYVAPEAAERDEYGAAGDIWALGCAVVEMASGRPAWAGSADAWGLFFKIGFTDELPPEVPAELSAEGKDFLRRCFVKQPEMRWSAAMLLQHPFVAAEEDLIDGDQCNSMENVISPTSAEEDLIDGDQCNSMENMISPTSVIGLSQMWSPRSPSSSICFSVIESAAPIDRIREIATAERPNWSSSSSSSGDWIDVRIPDTYLDPDLLPEEEEVASRIGCRYYELSASSEEVCSVSTIQLSLPLSVFKRRDPTQRC